MSDNVTRNLAIVAQMRLDELAKPHRVTPYRVDDETVVCIGCGFTVQDDLEHDETEVAWMRALVTAHDRRRR